jgi:hypothetical protein
MFPSLLSCAGEFNIVIDCNNAGVLAEFYSKLLGWEWTRPRANGGDCRCLSDRHGVRFSGSGRVFSVKDTFSLIVLVSGLYTLFWIYYNISNVFSFERSSIFSGRYLAMLRVTMIISILSNS